MMTGIGASSIARRNCSSLARSASSARFRAVMSTNVTTTPSIRLSVVRYGSTRRR